MEVEVGWEIRCLQSETKASKVLFCLSSSGWVLRTSLRKYDPVRRCMALWSYMHLLGMPGCKACPSPEQLVHRQLSRSLPHSLTRACMRGTRVKRLTYCWQIVPCLLKCTGPSAISLSAVTQPTMCVGVIWPFLSLCGIEAWETSENMLTLWWLLLLWIIYLCLCFCQVILCSLSASMIW